MNKKEKIQFYKKQLSTAKILESVAEQQKQLAARLGSEAKSALDLLGASTERTRKGYELSEEDKMALMANMLK